MTNAITIEESKKQIQSIDVTVNKSAVRLLAARSGKLLAVITLFIAGALFAKELVSFQAAHTINLERLLESNIALNLALAALLLYASKCNARRRIFIMVSLAAMVSGAAAFALSC